MTVHTDMCPRHGKPRLTGDAFRDAFLSYSGKDGAVCTTCAEYIPECYERSVFQEFEHICEIAIIDANPTVCIPQELATKILDILENAAE